MTSLPETPSNVLVVRDGKVVHQESHGLADPVAGTPLTPDHRFQIASISKQFTAAATLLLADAGKLSVDDPLSKWVSGSPESWKPLTLHHLLSNSSGIGHWNDYPEIDLGEPMPIDDLIATFQQRELFCEPGSQFRYSSAGFCLLAHIVELVSDTPYREFLDQRIFTPLGMTDTFAGNAGDRPNIAVGCAPDGTPREKLFELDLVGRGAGDIWSTTTDMVTWNQAVADGRILSDESRRRSFTPHVFCDSVFDEEHHYGYGWFVGTIKHPVRYHTGGNAGFESFSGWFPELSAHVVFLTNRDGYFSEIGNEGQRELILEHLSG
ncbi:serine hydrolase domain-containing protein [Stackebrandtia nassauensis]|uniref:Beta-lactamase n=1 Tax=Stackebrandtia nassauensis (strain DSM 44728 / CIP 108903 / NRRL B-16338 / NBRC 102104 / LLR-40K-21) TaxID=446470 RepID=D3Q2S7_STANL|nr:serine hydrolase domain-containing protein [Stackebrandtia nassauensis]ADD45828.1 beta-lactamase [Stackebrandtia nassauensis DSM 44728]